MPYIVSTPPHIKAEQDISRIMKLVCLALVPVFAWAFLNFGWYSLLVTALCVGACVLTEYVCQRLRGVEVTIHDYSAVVTGLLLAAVLPPNVSWYVAVIGGVFAIGIAKQAFGGLGNNIWNPALLARAFLQVAYASQLNSGSWVRVTEKKGILTSLGTTLAGSFDSLAQSPDVVSGATMMARIARPVAEAKDFVIEPSWKLIAQSSLGLEGGTIGEVSALFLLLGGAFLLWKKIITWEIPVAYIGTVALLAWILPAPFKYQAPGMAETQILYTPWFSGPWLLHVVGGGLLIGAFFMATDMVTSPVSFRGRLIFGIGCGILTVAIRLYSSAYPEGVCYSILLMNTCVPLIDAWTRPRVFGRPARAAEGT